LDSATAASSNVNVSSSGRNQPNRPDFSIHLDSDDEKGDDESDDDDEETRQKKKLEAQLKRTEAAAKRKADEERKKIEAEEAASKKKVDAIELESQKTKIVPSINDFSGNLAGQGSDPSSSHTNHGSGTSLPASTSHINPERMARFTPNLMPMQSLGIPPPAPHNLVPHGQSSSQQQSSAFDSSLDSSSRFQQFNQSENRHGSDDQYDRANKRPRLDADDGLGSMQQNQLQYQHMGAVENPDQSTTPAGMISVLSTTLWVGLGQNVEPNMDELMQVFSMFGERPYIKVKSGMAFVRFSTRERAEDASQQIQSLRSQYPWNIKWAKGMWFSDSNFDQKNGVSVLPIEEYEAIKRGNVDRGSGGGVGGGGGRGGGGFRGGRGGGRGGRGGYGQYQHQPKYQQYQQPQQDFSQNY
jgi:hypothetical protein